MNFNLFIQAIIKMLAGVISVGILLFVPAQTFEYWNAWFFMGLIFVPMFIAGIVLMIKSPELLKKRLNMKEKEKEQKKVILLSAIMFILGFISAGLSYRFQFLMLPKSVAIIASGIFILGYILYAEVIRENPYLSRVIEVQENQKVIDTGLYKLVRHPMYMATILLFLSIPLILGSLISFVIFLEYPFIIAKRIKNEEEFLEKELDGYADYKKNVKYKVIPLVW